jgi:Na+-translocating ferredoxin:NAD+ oxidoreductase RNF subunit RnfB
MNNRNKYIFIIIIFIACLLVTSFMSCRHEPVLLAELDTVCFSEQVLPIIQTSCGISGCHDNGTASEEFVATSYESIMKAVKPGDARGSLLYEVITDINAEHFMPPGRPLSQQQRTLIHLWIAQGAFNNSCIESSCDTAGTVSFNTQVWPVINNNCTGCHNSSNSRGGVNLEGYAQVKTYAETLQNGTPILVGVINYMNGFANMPPSGKLDDCSIRKIELWIGQGITDN